LGETHPVGASAVHSFGGNKCFHNDEVSQMRPSISIRKVFAACALAGLASLSLSATAATQTFFSNPSNTTVGGEAVFTPGTNTITLTLTNTLADLSSLAQTLSDISFTVSGGGAVTTSSVTTTANLIGLTDGSTTQTHTTGTTNPWTLSASGGGYLFTGLNGGDQTRSLILGSITSPSTYCVPKCPDGLGNSNFNPFIDQTATFTLGIAGVTAASTISNVVFSFGTQPETLVGVPIPAAVWLFGSGLIGLIGIARRRSNGSAKLTPAMA
jgi:hypothetical protein